MMAESKKQGKLYRQSKNNPAPGGTGRVMCGEEIFV